MTAEFRGFMPLVRNRETTSISPPSNRLKLAISPPQFLCLSLLLLCTLSGCASEEAKPAPPPPGVTVTPVVRKDMDIQQEWVGNTLGNNDADIRPKVDGFLLTQLYSEGSYVIKGQPMFQLDQRQTQAAVQQAQGKLERARAGLAQAQIDVKRYTPLVAQRAVSQAELDKATSTERAATAEADADQAALDNANLNLGWTTVTSPISGIGHFQSWRRGSDDAVNGDDDDFERESHLR